jgi:hypothetical protein
MQVDLQGLGLAAKWPKLHRLQRGLADFRRRQQKAADEAQALRANLPHARERDLVAEANAVRQGKTPPEPTHEPAVEADLKAAERTRDVLARAVQAVHEDLGNHLARHQQDLYQDVLEARRKVAAGLAVHAREALARYGRYEDLARVVKDLRPAEPSNENAPAQRLTTVFANVVHTTQTGPARGDVEQTLSYLAGLGEAEEEGGSDAA